MVGRTAITARWLLPVVASLAFATGAAGGPARSLDAVLTPTNPILPKAKVGQFPDYTVTFSVRVNGERDKVFGCRTTGLPPELPQFDDCGKLPPGLRNVALSGGACPGSPGIACDWSLSGRPTKAGTYKFRIAATNGDNGLIVREYTLVVEPATPRAKPTGADLAVTISGPSVLPANANATYRARVVNKGPDTARDIRVAFETSNPDVRVVRLRSTVADCPRKTATCFRDSLARGSALEVSVSLRSGSLDRDAQRTLTATVASASDPNERNNDAVLVLRAHGPPQLRVEVRGTKQIPYSEDRPPLDGRYLISVVNDGDGEATGLYLTLAWFDGRGRAAEVQMSVPARAGECEPDGLVVTAHRLTCRLDGLSAGRALLLSFLVFLHGENGPTVEDAFALARTGALVLRVDVRAKEREQTPPGLTDNKAQHRTAFAEVK